MADHIRHLAVYVDEPDHGCFHWVIIESTEDASVWTDVDSSEESFDMWLDAYSAGNRALMKLVEDERIESPRFLRRLNTLRGLSHEQVEQVLTRGA